MLTLWSIFRSPLILGGELRENRPEDLEVITNRDILEINQYSSENAQLYRNRESAAWTCLDKNGKRVVALFNLTDEDREITISPEKYCIEAKGKAIELWTKQEALFEKEISAEIKAHGTMIFRFS